MPDLAERLIASWRQAAADLGIEFIAPYHLITPDHRRLDYLGLVRHFGGGVGTLVRVLQLGELSTFAVIDSDYHVAKLGDRHILYDPLVFRGTLIQWGWTGPPESRPAWVPHARPKPGAADADPRRSQVLVNRPGARDVSGSGDSP